MTFLAVATKPVMFCWTSKTYLSGLWWFLLNENRHYYGSFPNPLRSGMCAEKEHHLCVLKCMRLVLPRNCPLRTAESQASIVWTYPLHNHAVAVATP